MKHRVCQMQHCYSARSPQELQHRLFLEVKAHGVNTGQPKSCAGSQAAGMVYGRGKHTWEFYIWHLVLVGHEECQKLMDYLFFYVFGDL